MHRAVIAIAVGGLLAGCSKKDGGAPAPAAKPAEEQVKVAVQPPAPAPAAPDNRDPGTPDDGVDPMWEKELVALDGEPPALKALATDKLDAALGPRLQARIPEVIGTCMTADTEIGQWFVARGTRLYAAGVCWEGTDYRVALFALDEHQVIAPVGRASFHTEALGALRIEEAAGVACVATDLAGGDAAAPWRTCFAVDDKVLADRATRGPVATRLATCPDAVTAITACKGDASFVKALADGSPVGADPAEVTALLAQWSPATCSSWIEQPESYQARQWTVPIDDYAALTSAAKSGCAALAAAIVEAGGLPYPTGE